MATPKSGAQRDCKFTEVGSAEFFVKNNGDIVVQNRGVLKDGLVACICTYMPLWDFQAKFYDLYG